MLNYDFRSAREQLQFALRNRVRQRRRARGAVSAATKSQRSRRSAIALNEQ